MPVFRVNNYIDAYRLRAQCDDLHELAARPDKKFVTQFVSRQILDSIQLGGDDVLVDIGCGDATLLKMAEGHAAKCLGIVASNEEHRRLESALPGLSFVTSPAQSLPLGSAVASKVVCNATLFYLPSPNDVAAALREMARIARPGAIIWVGEIPEIDEYAHYGMYRGQSMLGFLWHLLKRQGVRAFLGMIRRWFRALTGDERIVLNSAGMFHASPQVLVPMAQGCGLYLKSYFRHKELNEEGRIVESRFRYDYVFTV